MPKIPFSIRSLLPLACAVATTLAAPRPARADDYEGGRSARACDADLGHAREPRIRVRHGTVEAPHLALPFRTVRNARHRVETIRTRGPEYLTPMELARLDHAVTALETDAGFAGRNVELAALLIGTAEANFVRDFTRDRARVAAELSARAAAVADLTEHRVFLNRLAESIGSATAPFTLERQGSTWARARAELARPVDPRTVIRPAVIERLARTVKAVARPTHGDFAYVMELGALGSVENRARFRAAMEATFTHAQAVARDERRARAVALDPGRDVRYAWVPDLAVALGVFLEPPRVWVMSSKVVAEGPVTIDGTATLVAVRFDPRVRYFTVNLARPQAATFGGYYELLVGDDGRLEFLPERPVSTSFAGRHLDLTHFAY